MVNGYLYLLPLQASTKNWPPGPGELRELFQWHHYNAEQLLSKSPDCKRFQENFQNLMMHPIHVHDSYSGMGTGSVAFHIQYNQMVSHGLSCPRQLE